MQVVGCLTLCFIFLHGIKIKKNSGPLFILGVNRSWDLVVSSHGQPEEQSLGLAVIYSCVSYIEELVDVLFTV